MARPGTIDYSKWERLAAELSSSDEEVRPASINGLSDDYDSVNRMYDDDDGSFEDRDDDQANIDEGHMRKARRLMGTCLNCGATDATKRCSRCQNAWFCDSDCQAEAWATHAVNCFACSETEAWWGKLTSGSQTSGARDLTAALQQRLEYRRAAAATHERRRAAAAAAAQAAAARARQGQEKGKGGKGQEEKEETCAVCQCEFTVAGDSGESICCPSSHFLCSECAGVFVQSIMNDLESSYPPKCSMCRAEVPMQSFERQLNQQQQQALAEFVTQKTLAESETMVKCQCGYMEIRTDKPVLWWCPTCQRGECQVCNQELPCRDSELKAADETAVLELDKLLQPHVIGCASLREAKQKVDQALEDGQKMPCPGCSLAGMKDEACTHMTCTRCQTSWCYLCGLSVDDCDKKPPRPGQRVDDIFLHNADWEVNPLRCPMYLTQILDVDPAWLGHDWEEGDEVSDDKCLSYFHRWRTIKLLQEVREEVGASTFEQVWLHFGSVRSAGYDIEEIIHTDTSVLIDREAFEGEDDDEDDTDEVVR